MPWPSGRSCSRLGILLIFFVALNEKKQIVVTMRGVLMRSAPGNNRPRQPDQFPPAASAAVEELLSGL